MPAPTPIQIRYGPAGLLAQAASMAGRNDAWQNQHAQDMQFINGRLANADKIQQDVVAGQQQGANRLQQAYAQTQQPVAATGAQPINADEAALKQTYLASQAANIPDSEKANFAALARSKVPFAEFHQAVSDAADRHTKETVAAGKVTDAATNLQAKHDYAQQVLPNMPEEDKAGFIAFAKDPQTTAAQVRAAGDAIIQRASMKQRVAVAQQGENLTKQLTQVTSHMNTLAKQLAANGVDVTAPPSQMNPKYNPPIQHPDNPLVNLGLSEGHASLEIAPGKADQMPMYKAYLQAQRVRDALQAQKDSLDSRTSGAVGTPIDPTSVHIDNGGQIVPVNSPAEAANLPTGTAFVTPDGQHWVKH